MTFTDLEPGDIIKFSYARNELFVVLAVEDGREQTIAIRTQSSLNLFSEKHVFFSHEKFEDFISVIELVE